jgi:hypothetical protein
MPAPSGPTSACLARKLQVRWPVVLWLAISARRIGARLPREQARNICTRADSARVRRGRGRAWPHSFGVPSGWSSDRRMARRGLVPLPDLGLAVRLLAPG